MDKKAILVIGLCVLVIVFSRQITEFLFGPVAGPAARKEPEPPEAGQAAASRPAVQPPVQTRPRPATAQAPATAPTSQPAGPPPRPEPKVPIQSNLLLPEGGPQAGSTLWASLTNVGAAVEAVWLRDYFKADTTQPLKLVGDDSRSQPSLLLTLVSGDQTIDLGHVTWATQRRPDELIFSTEAPAVGLAVTKRYRLPRDSYVLHLELTFRVLPGATPPADLCYQITSANGLALEGLEYSSRVYRNTAFGLIQNDAGRVKLVTVDPGSIPHPSDEALKDPKDRRKAPLYDTTPIKWCGVDTQYFTSLLIPRPAKDQARWEKAATSIAVGPKNPETHYQNIAAQLTSRPLALGPDRPVIHAYDLYVGPKLKDILDRYDVSEILDYGFFGPISQVMVAVLVFFGRLTGNYGLAVILLTIAVRIVLFPLSRKQYISMHRMQRIQPLVKEINEKYKNDRQAKSQALMELYRKHKVNPMGGCLPLLIQLPIFIGLYNGLWYSVQIRQRGFLWVSDLTAPDRLFRFPADVALPFLGHWFNLLPILAIVGMWLQQKLSQPPPADPQQAQQRKIMSIMMVVFGFIFYNIAAGLCLYFITSSALQFFEQKVLLGKIIHDVPEAGAAAGASPPADLAKRPVLRKRFKDRRR